MLSKVRRACSVSDEIQEEVSFIEKESSMPNGFDLAHCIALAGCSFEAYTDPDAVTGFAEISWNGTKTIYTDKDFVEETFQGLLQIHLRGAQKLPGRDVIHITLLLTGMCVQLFGTSDPYVKINVDGSTAVSKIIFAENNPQWHETFYLFVP